VRAQLADHNQAVARTHFSEERLVEDIAAVLRSAEVPPPGPHLGGRSDIASLAP
jgi:hypothetical protein